MRAAPHAATYGACFWPSSLSSARTSSCCRSSLSYVFTHAARAVVPRAELGADYEQVAFETADGLTLKGWYVPSQ